ncbi:MAG: hypothetical protein CVU05_06695 [Bacteroidetes bacterium HGW-Bacteroidetes-21]|jgi:PAS domain S-box-containing protein|nr:MAG: hypothetical protein CVU05_06695 [Bacteroidetes bacterium HGW-Bacteroidetes-21]
MKNRVLVVEDDLSISTLLKIKLENKGYDVKTLYSGKAAIDFLKDNDNWLLLADYRLTDMNCDEIIIQLKSMNISPPFIVMTGMSEQQLAVDMMKMGAIDFIIKSIGFAETVIAVVERAFETILMRRALDQSIENIKESELKFRMFFENIQDIFFMTELDGKVIEVSPSVKTVLGYEPYEIISESIGHLFLYNSDFRRIKHQLTNDGISEFAAVLLKHKDTSLKSLSVVCNIVDLGRRGLRIIGVARNVSEKRQMEAEMMKKVMEAEENERKKIAEDIHDDVGPILSVIKMYFELISNSGEDTVKRKKLLGKVQDLIDNSIHKIRTITQTLTPNILEQYGLEKAIKSFVESIAFVSRINFKIEVIDMEFEKAMEVYLYRTSVELINNSLKHSEAKNINLRVVMTQKGLELIYTDDGNGFDLNEKLYSGKIKGNGLLSIINRTKMMSGNLSLRSNPGKGVKVKIVFDNQLI